LPDLLAKSLNITKNQGPKGQKPYTIEKLSSQEFFVSVKFFKIVLHLKCEGMRLPFSNGGSTYAMFHENVRVSFQNIRIENLCNVQTSSIVRIPLHMYCAMVASVLKRKKCQIFKYAYFVIKNPEVTCQGRNKNPEPPVKKINSLYTVILWALTAKKGQLMH